MSQRGYFQNVETHDEKEEEQHQQDGEERPAAGTLSKQFVPKKYKDGAAKLWNREQEAQAQSYSYTPFKGSTMQRVTTTPKSIRDSQSTASRPPKPPNPFVYDPPTTQSTPKVGRRADSAAGNHPTMSREQKLTWGKMGPPTSAQYRSASAMGTIRGVPRPVDFGPVQPYQHSRYQSYCTLPRPEQQEDFLNYYGPKMVSVSRAPSALGHPMASNLPTFIPPPMMAPPPQMTAKVSEAFLQPIVNWNTISLLCCMQVLCCVGIFGVGIARMIFGSQWAIGLELLFATSAIVPALVGIFAVKTSSFPALIFCFTFHLISIVFASVPFIIGLFPAFPWVFPKVNPSWFVATGELIHLDFALSLLIALQVFFSFLICVSVSKTIGNYLKRVDELKMEGLVNRAYEDQAYKI